MKGVPLRDWNSASYSATDGRAAKSSEGPRESYSADGERWSVSRQIPDSDPGVNGGMSWKQMDARNSRSANKRG